MAYDVRLFVDDPLAGRIAEEIAAGKLVGWPVIEPQIRRSVPGAHLVMAGAAHSAAEKTLQAGARSSSNDWRPTRSWPH